MLTIHKQLEFNLDKLLLNLLKVILNMNFKIIIIKTNNLTV